MLSALSDEQAEYLIVGAYAVAAHGLPRATKDIDIWVRPGEENIQRVWRALAKFGAPMDAHSMRDLLDPELVHQIGVEPHRIDILKKVTGLEFDEAWRQHDEFQVDGVRFPCISRHDLIRSKLAAGRDTDRADVARLQRQAENLKDR